MNRDQTQSRTPVGWWVIARTSSLPTIGSAERFARHPCQPLRIHSPHYFTSAGGSDRSASADPSAGETVTFRAACSHHPTWGLLATYSLSERFFPWSAGASCAPSNVAISERAAYAGHR